jgi:DNA-binding CsgD family transcriptional regulator
MKTERAAPERRGQSSAPLATEAPLLLEREREIEALETAIAAAARGAGQIVVVEGPPGMGKTRLLAYARAAAHRSDLLVLDGRGAELEREFAFGVVRQLLEPSIFGLESDERARLFAGAAALAERLFDPDPSPDVANGVDAGFATFHGLYWLVVNLADSVPVLVCVDDTHWADPQTLRFLDYLAHRVEGLAVAMVLAGRPPGASEPGSVWTEVVAQPSAIALHPQPLSEEGVRALVRDRLGSDAVDQFCAACHLATQGNPLFLRELLASLAATGVPPSADATGVVDALGPAAVSRFVLHRLAALGTQATELARAVAVLGDDTDIRLAARVAGLAEDEARRVADDLVRADLLSPSEQLCFVHPIVRAAIYEDLAPGERQLRHAAAADTLAEGDAASERVAAHLLLTAPARDDRHAGILRSAAQDAMRRGAPDAAVVYLRRALDEPPPSDQLGGMLVDLGNCELAEMQFSAAEEHLRAALATSDDSGTRARAASLLGRCAVLSGGLSAEAAASTVESMAEELGPDDRERSLDLRADLLILTASVPRLRPDLTGRLARFQRLAAGDSRYEAVAELHASQEGLLRGDPAAASVERTQAALAAELPAEAIINTLFVALMTFVYAERYDLASSLLDAGLDLTRQQGHVARQGVLHGQRAAIALAKGALDDAQIEAETGFALVSERHFVVVQLAAVAIVVHIERGDLQAAAAAEERGAVFGFTEDRIFLDDYVTSRGRLRIAQGEVREGVADLLWCGERLEALGVRWPSSWRAFAAPALASLGEEDRAAELAQEQIELARSVGARCALGRALRTGGLAIGGEAGLRLLEEAVGVLEATPARLELAHALADLGAELGRRRRRREGREVLRLAMELAVECGAFALADRARAELAAGGGRRPRLELTGVNALTPAERRVCELAADGELTNRTIAQTLFVTEKTVELHLTSAYRKLGIRSRFQLATVLSS